MARYLALFAAVVRAADLLFVDTPSLRAGLVSEHKIALNLGFTGKLTSCGLDDDKLIRCSGYNL